MEILIPGLILVGFMVWASTRIKRNASKAFEREEVSTAEYSLTKPEGFLSIVDPPDGLLFSAYSKEFGAEPAERIRRASAQLSRFPDAHFDNVVERVTAESDSLISQQTGVIDGHKCATIIAERLERGVPVESHYKIIAGRDAVYQLRADILPDHREEFKRKIDEILTSFSLN